MSTQRTILGHPPGLFILFFTEMWERFSYYGMRSLLVLFMVDHLFLRPDVGQEVLGFNAIKGTLESIFGPLAIQPLSSQIYGLYTAFVYLTPLFGGILADRWLGRRKTVVVGAILMAIGHFLMAIENLFFIALLFLGWLWGIWGLVLGVPVLVGVKGVWERVDEPEPIGGLLGS